MLAGTEQVPADVDRGASPTRRPRRCRWPARALALSAAASAGLIAAASAPGSTTVTNTCTYDLGGVPMTVNRQLTLYIRSDGRNIVKDGDPPQSVAPGAVLYAYAVIQGGPIGDFYQPFSASFSGQAGSGITEPLYAVDLNAPSRRQ